MLLGKELVEIYERLNSVLAKIEDIEEMTLHSDRQVSDLALDAGFELTGVLEIIRGSLDEEPSDLNFEED